MKTIINKFSLLIVLLSIGLSINTVAVAKLPAQVNGRALPSLADMLDGITPAVVNISTQKPEKNKKLRDPVLRHYFGRKLPEKKKDSIGTGSGIVIDAENGYIVTNAHVIDGAGKIIVTLKDKRQFYATVIGIDLKADVAVIRIQPDNLTDMPVANSAKLRVGDFVVAIGNPYGLGQSVSSGIISALGRTGLGIEDYEDFIQTDASINPGNSGGALVNLKGELIGINTAILGGRGGGNVGISFAIPSNMVTNIKDQLIQFGKVERGQLGIEIQDVRPNLVKAFDLPNGSGAMISSVVAKSPADKAGIREGDVITHINGLKVKSSSNLKNIIGNLRMGSKVDMKYIRDGSIKKAIALVGKVGTSSYTVKKKRVKSVPPSFMNDE